VFNTLSIYAFIPIQRDYEMDVKWTETMPREVTMTFSIITIRFQFSRQNIAGISLYRYSALLETATLFSLGASGSIKLRVLPATNHFFDVENQAA
jgi:hypothetical protein